MYLAQKVIEGKNHYFIRQSYRQDDTYLSRDLFDLGTNPAKYIVYPGGNAFYFDDAVIERLDALGIREGNDELEDIFWRFLKPDIQRALEHFRRREKRLKIPIKAREEDLAVRYHIFDKRRIHFLKFGSMEQRNLGRLPTKLFRMLRQKSRDEIEQKFIEMESVLRPTEFKAYTYVIFNLQHFFSQWFAKETPQMLDPRKVDEYFLDEICTLNKDKRFWGGMEVDDSLHEYLARYVFMYFDYEYAPKSFIQEYIWNFVNSRRDYRPPYSACAVTLSEASTIFGETKDALKKMSRRNFTRLYRRRAQTLHPDKGGDHEKFVKLTQAYHALLKTKKK